jgi:hypothetical protein
MMACLHDGMKVNVCEGCLKLQAENEKLRKVVEAAKAYTNNHIECLTETCKMCIDKKTCEEQLLDKLKELDD